MARLIAPNGVEVNASAADEPVLMAAGYVPAEQPKAAPRKRAAKPKPKAQGE